jgi:uracil-DNA glycosylase
MALTHLGSLPEGWGEVLAPVVQSPRVHQLTKFLDAERRENVCVLPPEPLYLRALELTSLPCVRVVILGQDPYHQVGRATGLAFSMCSTPRDSLLNILREVERDLGFPVPERGSLEPWARQGVLLLNTVLTVRRGAAKSHFHKGWEYLTDAVLRAVAGRDEPVVFMLWGGPAKEKAALIRAADKERRHCVLETSHPSNQGARHGFRGCGHFSRANDFLLSKDRGEIDWSLSELASQSPPAASATPV